MHQMAAGSNHLTAQPHNDGTGTRFSPEFPSQSPDVRRMNHI